MTTEAEQFTSEYIKAREQMLRAEAEAILRAQRQEEMLADYRREIAGLRGNLVAIAAIQRRWRQKGLDV